MRRIISGLIAATLAMPLALLALGGSTAATATGRGHDCRRWVALTFDDGPSHLPYPDAAYAAGPQSRDVLRCRPARRGQPSVRRVRGPRGASRPQPHLEPSAPAALTPAQVRPRCCVPRTCFARPARRCRSNCCVRRSATWTTPSRPSWPRSATTTSTGTSSPSIGMWRRERPDPRHHRHRLPARPGHPDARRPDRLRRRPGRRNRTAAGHPPAAAPATASASSARPAPSPRPACVPCGRRSPR